MLFYLILIFTLLPIIELALLIRVASAIDLGPTILLVIVTGVVGAWLARREGLRVMWQIQSELGSGKLPGDRLIDAMLILVAGVVLVTPGLITDTIGVLLLIPPVRTVIRRFLKRTFKARFTIVDLSQQQYQRPQDPNMVDVDARVIDDDDLE